MSPTDVVFSELTLFLLLELLNKPPTPPPPPLDDFAGSSPSPDFLRESVKAPLSGEGFRLDLAGDGETSLGSTMLGTFDRSVADTGLEEESSEIMLVWALISGEDRVR
jgi:hypothetical protein